MEDNPGEPKSVKEVTDDDDDRIAAEVESQS